MHNKMNNPFFDRAGFNEHDEISTRNQGICSSCFTMFKIKKPYQLFCSDDCEQFYGQKADQKLIAHCDTCKKEYKRTQNRSGFNLCNDCLRSYRERTKANQKEEYRKESLKNYQNQKKRKSVPLHVLIKRSEHKRVWQDSGWTHYLKGRKWDRI
jgi:hypothetical protein